MMPRYSPILRTLVTTETHPLPDGYVMKINRYGDGRTPQVFIDGAGASLVRYWSEDRIRKFLQEVKRKDK